MSSTKQSKRIFVALTIMALCLVVAIFSPIDGNMPKWARVAGALFIGGIVTYFLTRTKAGQETTKDYTAGAKSTYQQGQELIRKGKELVEQGIEEGHKLIADGEAMVKEYFERKS